MRVKMFVAAMAIAVTGAVAPSAVAADASKVTIKYLGGGEFTGKVKSENADCVAERTVVLYKLTGATPSPRKDDKIVTDTTDTDGSWNTGQTGEKSGKFYAKVKKTDICRGARSKVVTATG